MYNSILSQVSLCIKARGTCLLTDCTLSIRKAHGIRLQSCLHRKGRVVGSLLLRSEVCGLSSQSTVRTSDMSSNITVPDDKWKQSGWFPAHAAILLRFLWALAGAAISSSPWFLYIYIIIFSIHSFLCWLVSRALHVVFWKRRRYTHETWLADTHLAVKKTSRIWKA